MLFCSKLATSWLTLLLLNLHFGGQAKAYLIKERVWDSRDFTRSSRLIKCTFWTAGFPRIPKKKVFDYGRSCFEYAKSCKLGTIFKKKKKKKGEKIKHVLSFSFFGRFYITFHCRTYNLTDNYRLD